MNDLELRIRNVLAEASLIAEASAAGLSEPTSHGKSGSKEPTTSGVSTYDQIHRQLRSARGHQQTLDAIVWAEELVRTIKRRTRGTDMTPGEWRFWLVEQHEGKHYADVAKEEGISTSYVRKIREEFGRDPLRGRPYRSAA